MIRPAVPTDIYRLIEMGEAFHKEARVGERHEELTFDRDSFAFTCGILMDAGMMLVKEVDGEVVGMAAMDAAPCFLNRNFVVGREQFWYIDGRHRKGRDGSGLLTALETLAKDRGVHLFDVVAEEGERSTPLGRLYRRGGFNPCETVYRKRL